MRMFVKAEVLPTIVGAEQVGPLREAVGRSIGRLQESGKLEAGWVTADGRCPMFIVNVDTAAELQELLGGELIDNCAIETHPILSWEELAAFFENHPPS